MAACGGDGVTSELHRTGTANRTTPNYADGHLRRQCLQAVEDRPFGATHAEDVVITAPAVREKRVLKHDKQARQPTDLEAASHEHGLIAFHPGTFIMMITPQLPP